MGRGFGIGCLQALQQNSYFLGDEFHRSDATFVTSFPGRQYYRQWRELNRL